MFSYNNYSLHPFLGDHDPDNLLEKLLPNASHDLFCFLLLISFRLILVVGHLNSICIDPINYLKNG